MIKLQRLRWLRIYKDSFYKIYMVYIQLDFIYILQNDRAMEEK